MPAPPDRYDVAIVLGALLRPDGSPSPAMRRRVEHAVALHRDGRAERLLMSGGGAPPEAEAMAALAIAAGIAAARVQVEPRSRNTVENALYSLPLLAPGARVVVVTDAWHLPRALHVFRRLGARVDGSSPAPGRLSARWRCMARELAVFPLTLWRLDRLGRSRPEGQLRF